MLVERSGDLSSRLVGQVEQAFEAPDLAAQRFGVRGIQAYSIVQRAGVCQAVLQEGLQLFPADRRAAVDERFLVRWPHCITTVVFAQLP